jgi:hypothetical protein
MQQRGKDDEDDEDGEDISDLLWGVDQNTMGRYSVNSEEASCRVRHSTGVGRTIPTLLESWNNLSVRLQK